MRLDRENWSDWLVWPNDSFHWPGVCTLKTDAKSIHCFQKHTKPIKTRFSRSNVIQNSIDLRVWELLTRRWNVWHWERHCVFTSGGERVNCFLQTLIVFFSSKELSTVYKKKSIQINITPAMSALATFLQVHKQGQTMNLCKLERVNTFNARSFTEWRPIPTACWKLSFLENTPSLNTCTNCVVQKSSRKMVLFSKCEYCRLCFYFLFILKFST
jgi:hypothetical protein